MFIIVGILLFFPLLIFPEARGEISGILPKRKRLSRRMPQEKAQCFAYSV
jgi:hypothetical protein